MRTKVMLAAAFLAAGLASSMAQNVYSLNVVGYYNVTLPAGFSLVANQLTVDTNGINEVWPTGVYGDEILTFKNNDYNVDVNDGTQWLDNNTGNTSTTVLPPGKGFFYENLNSTITQTFVGTVPQGPLSLAMPAGFTLVSTMTPQALELSAANGFPQIYGMEMLTFANNNYTIYVNDGTEWLDNNTGNTVTLIPAVGQGFFIENLDATTYNWNRTFTVQ